MKNYRSERSPALDQINDQDNDRDNEQDVNEAAQGVTANESEQPEHE
jgi:hypothetical protein